MRNLPGGFDSHVLPPIYCNYCFFAIKTLIFFFVPSFDGPQTPIVKCATCHVVKDILSSNNSREEWERIVNRMVKLAAPQITPGEARQIIYFLATEYGPRNGAPVKQPATPAR
jgi:hypothetical protein